MGVSKVQVKGRISSRCDQLDEYHCNRYKMQGRPSKRLKVRSFDIVNKGDVYHDWIRYVYDTKPIP